MGYLDNSTIVVDAILTKQGRKLLASGQGLNISYFTLSDTGIDYTLWNPDHPSGSAYYGEAIENLPNLEALPNAAYFMRNSLITLSRDTVELPFVALNGEGIGVTVTKNFGSSMKQQSITPKLENSTETQGWQLVIPDKSLFTAITGGWKQIDISGISGQFLNDQEIENAALYENTSDDTPPVFLDRAETTQTRSVVITFISKSTGAYKSATVTMDRVKRDKG
jgi:hypothetical protein